MSIQDKEYLPVMLKSVAIPWDILLRAFSNMESDRIYYFDRVTGDVFFVSTEMEEAFWNQLEQHQERFLEIPGLDLGTERSLLSSFMQQQASKELRQLLDHSLSGRLPYGNPADILSFFPEEEQQLAEFRDTFVSNRVKSWLEEHELFSMSTSLTAVH